ncbi:MAG: isoprenylcysteine carboxylmethyltransferase family protein [Candidatus Omnitrophica bacterium]|nr:isoprenylcysteine carboxylmethyltransferase family protein [Candidatus Omnitrophota bacterium]
MKRRLKINGMIIFLAVLLSAIFPSFFLKDERFHPFDEFTEIFGIAFILLGQLFRLSARGYKVEFSRQGSFLIQDGPYGLVRHPMYLGIFLIGIGIVLVIFKWWVLLLFLVVFSWRYILLIFKEENELSFKFGRAHQDYQKKTPLFFPSLKMILQEDIAEYVPLKFSWLKKEIGPMLAILLLTLAVESGEDICRGGLKAYSRELILFSLILTLFILLIIYLIDRGRGSNQNDSGKSKINL